MTISKTDVTRIKALLDEAAQTEGSTADKARRIMHEMPHLTTNDVAQVARVHAEEMRLEVAELRAAAAASLRICDILKEAKALNLLDALEKLGNRARAGDERARELQHELHEAMLKATME